MVSSLGVHSLLVVMASSHLGLALVRAANSSRLTFLVSMTVTSAC
jgi:hypothetical protein